MKFIKATLYYSDKEILINPSVITSIHPSAFGGSLVFYNGSADGNQFADNIKENLSELWTRINGQGI